MRTTSAPPAIGARVASGLLSAGICVLALHLFLILLTGGYSVGVHALTIGGHAITGAMMLLLGLVILRLAIRRRAGGSHVFFSHEVAILFSSILLVYLANGRTIWSGDTVPAKYLPLSILREGNFDLDEFPFLFDRDRFPFPYFLRLVGGHYVSDYPIGAALLALPVYLPSALGHVDPRSPLIDELEKLAAAAVVALSAVLLYGTLRRLTSDRDSLFIAVVYALGTSSLSESSQALWQHGASQLALTAAFYCLVRGRQEPGWVAFAGFPMAFAIISRPTDALLGLPLGLYVLLHHRRQLAGFLLAGLPPVLFQLWYNAVYFKDPLRVQFFATLSTAVRDLPAGAAAWDTPLGSGLAGILLSPSRGLFVYSPVFLLSVAGILLAWRKRGDLLLRYAGAGVVLMVLVYAKWMTWWGGMSYGPRLLADLSPILALCLYPVGPAARRSRVLAAAVVILAVWSVGAHAIGAFVDDRAWSEDAKAEIFPERFWSWTDNPLVNPPREALVRALRAVSNLSTSATTSAPLAASYRPDSAPTRTLQACKAIQLSVRATNIGSAVWLPQSARGVGQVSLGWRWRRGDHALLPRAGQVPLRTSVFPGQSYDFWASIEAPAEPGSYLLELGLLSERQPWPREATRSPSSLYVVVEPAPKVPEQPWEIDSLREGASLGEDPPLYRLFTDRPRYQRGDVLRLGLTESVGARAWWVDAYLLLHGPGGALWFYDGRRIGHPGDCGWEPLARAVRLPRGRTGAGPVLDLPLAGMPEGIYTWRLLLTEADRYRILTEAEAGFDVTDSRRASP